MNEEEYIDSLFIKAGWYKGRNIELSELRNSNSEAHFQAINLLKEYGSLKVGEVGAGRECATSDIVFYSRPRYEAEDICERWKSTTGEIIAVASAHHEQIMIFVSSKGQFYLFTEPDEQLYLGGSFKEKTRKLLLGLDYGNPIEKV